MYQVQKENLKRYLIDFLQTSNIYKAKIYAENTITLQAEGDPSTFNMNLTVLRNADGKMMDLIQYKI